MKKVLLVAGKIASGKGTIAAWKKAKDPGTPVYRFSDPLRDGYFNLLTDFRLCAGAKWRLLPKEPTAKHHERLAHTLLRTFGPFIVRRFRYRSLERFDAWLREDFSANRDPWHKHASTSDLQRLSTALRCAFGENLLAYAIRERIGATDHPSPVVEGVRRLIDVETLLFNASGYRPIFLYVDAPLPKRFEWFHLRNEKHGDSALTCLEFRALNGAETEREIPLLRPYAHYHIRNSGTKAKLVLKLEEIARKEGI